MCAMNVYPRKPYESALKSARESFYSAASGAAKQLGD